MSARTMKAMVENECYLIPTISAGKQVAEKAKIAGFFPAVVAKKALEIGPLHQATIKKAFENNVPMGFGTDAGVFPHGKNAIEFGYLLEAGVPVEESLRQATFVNAQLLGMETQLGQLEKGFLADIVAVNEDPFQKVDTLQDMVFVMKGGKVYKKD